MPGFWVMLIFFFKYLIFMYLSSLQKVLGLDSLEEVLDIKLVNSKFIIHNVYSVSKQGVVILDDKSSKYLKTILVVLFWPTMLAAQSHQLFLILP